jgi:hypothetical protein
MAQRSERGRRAPGSDSARPRGQHSGDLELLVDDDGHLPEFLSWSEKNAHAADDRSRPAKRGIGGESKEDEPRRGLDLELLRQSRTELGAVQELPQASAHAREQPQQLARPAARTGWGRAIFAAIERYRAQLPAPRSEDEGFAVMSEAAAAAESPLEEVVGSAFARQQRRRRELLHRFCFPIGVELPQGPLQAAANAAIPFPAVLAARLAALQPPTIVYRSEGTPPSEAMLATAGVSIAGSGEEGAAVIVPAALVARVRSTLELASRASGRSSDVGSKSSSSSSSSKGESGDDDMFA